MAVNDTYELRVHGHVLGQEHVHTLHFRQIVPVASATDLVTDYTAGALAAYRGCFSIDDPIVELLHAQAVCGTTPLPAAYEVALSGAGTFGTRVTNADRSPTFMAGLVTTRTALAGRSYRGRFFLGGLRDSDFLMNDMASAWITLAQAYVTALFTTFPVNLAAKFALVVHSRTLAAVPGTACQASSTLITNMVVSNRPTTMRSRKLGHGN